MDLFISIINFIFCINLQVMSNVGGQDFDYAFSYSMGGDTGILTPDDAAVDWMVTVNFREGNPMENDDPNEFQYQPRGYAKYAGKVSFVEEHCTRGLFSKWLLKLFEAFCTLTFHLKFHSFNNWQPMLT